MRSRWLVAANTRPGVTHKGASRFVDPTPRGGSPAGPAAQPPRAARRWSVSAAPSAVVSIVAVTMVAPAAAYAAAC